MRMNVRVKGDNTETIKAALDGAYGISEWRELGEGATLDEAQAELRALEEERTAQRSQFAKLQQQAAELMISNKQLKGAVARLDALASYLCSCIADNPLKDGEHAALNVLAHSFHTTHNKLAKTEAIVQLLHKAADASAKAAKPADAEKGNEPS